MISPIPSHSLDADDPASEALAAGVPQRFGSFRYFFDDDRWEWSDEVARMHGYDPHEVTPTTDLVLAHKHPDDRRHVATTLERIRRHRQAFSTRHRILDTHGREHHVIVVGDHLRNGDGAIVGTHGFYIDLSSSPDEQDRITEGVAQIAQRRAVIEQAKGALMALYDLDADAAFDILRWRSQETNTKLRTLAERLLAAFREVGGGVALPPRVTYDRLLVSVHERTTATEFNT